MKAVLLLLALAVLVSADVRLREQEFKSWMMKYPHTYASDAEYQLRCKIFTANLAYIENWNAEHPGEFEMKMAVNQFADLTHYEFKQYLAAHGSMPQHPTADVHRPLIGATLPDSIDWKAKGAVTKVKDQGQCGSCWSFSATGTMEGAWQISTGNLVALSEQQICDCSWSYGNEGCNGGWMQQAEQYVIDCGGIESEADYPYRTSSSKKCKFDKSKIAAHFSSYVNVTVGSENDLMDALANVGPISVAIDASQDSFQFYGGGIYNEIACRNGVDDLDHGVLAVGYGFLGKDASKEQYYLVKNSWGSGWGDAGYIKMSRNKKNQCGIATAASYIKV